MRQHDVRFASCLPFLLFLFPCAAKCDVVQVENKDPNSQEIGCGVVLLYGVLPGREGQGVLIGSLVTLPQTPRFWTAIFRIHRADCLLKGNVWKLPDKDLYPDYLSPHCQTNLSNCHICPDLSELYLLIKIRQRHKLRAGLSYSGSVSPQLFDRYDGSRTKPHGHQKGSAPCKCTCFVFLTFGFSMSQYAHVPRCPDDSARGIACARLTFHQWRRTVIRSKQSSVVGNTACLTIRHQTHLLCVDANSSVPVINRRQLLPKGWK